MVNDSERFIGLDVAKDRHAVAVAEVDRDGEVRSYGETRLTRRYRALIAPGKRGAVAITAVALEIVGFMWAIARMEPETS